MEEQTRPTIRKPKEQGRADQIASLDVQRRDAFWKFYIESVFAGRPNIVQSGLKAGYKKTYAQHIGKYDWFREGKARLERPDRLYKAEKVLDEVLDQDINEQAMGAYGPVYEGKGKEKTPVMRRNVALLRTKFEAAKFVTSTLGKGEGYNTQDFSTLNPQAVIPILGDLHVHLNDSDQKNSGPDPSHQGNPGRDERVQDAQYTVVADTPGAKRPKPNGNKRGVGILTTLEAGGNTRLPPDNA